MPIITALEPQQHDPERLNVFLDGRFAFGISSMLAATRSLRVGVELSDEDVAAIGVDDSIERAYNSALNFLSFRPRSAREVQSNLRRKGIEPHVIDAVIERLSGSGFVDDREFARFWVENRQTFRPRGTRALRVELQQKGVARDVVDESLDIIEDEEEIAFKAGLPRLRVMSRLDEREFFRKMSAFLQRRGFPWEVAAAATRRLYAEIGGTTEDDGAE